MKLKDVIRADKTVLDMGKWAAGTMPRTVFQLSKSKGRSYRLGSYRWRVIQFSALDQIFRLLIVYHAGKEQYRATLAVEIEADLAVLCSFEFHGTHPGWHFHVLCDPIDLIPRGVVRHPRQMRFPDVRRSHRNITCPILNDDRALDLAARKYKLWQTPGQLL